MLQPSQASHSLQQTLMHAHSCRQQTMQPAPVQQQQPGPPLHLLRLLQVLLLGLLHLTACELSALPAWPPSWQQHCGHCVLETQKQPQGVRQVQCLQEQLPCQAYLLLLPQLFPAAPP
jgi:hypothetical protein